MSTTLEQTRRADLDRLNALIFAAEESEQPEAKSLAKKAAKDFFEKYPDVAMEYGNIVQARIEEMIESIAPYFAEPVDQFLKSECVKLGFNESPNEQRLVIGWIIYHELAAIYAEKRAEASEYLQAAHRWDKVKNDAHRHIARYLGLLHKMRRLPVRNLTVNVMSQGTDLKTVDATVKEE